MTVPNHDNQVDDDLVTIATFPSPQEANIAKSALNAEGVEAFVQGEITTSMLSYYGSSVAGARLQVRKSDSSRATEFLSVIESREQPPESIGPWTCPNCQSEVDAGFAVCWSCGRDADDVSPPTQTDKRESEIPQDGHEEDQPTRIESPDELANRAFRAAIWGIVFFPFWFYATYLIVMVSDKPLSPIGKRKFYASVAIFVLLFIASLLIFQIIEGIRELD